MKNARLKSRLKYTFLLFVLLPSIKLIAATPAAPDLTIPSIFSSGMVIQQESEMQIWGSGTDGIQVIIVPEWGDSLKSEVLNGKWSVSFSTPSASFTSYKIDILQRNGTEEAQLIKSIDNILVGEVWLASGQSNMKMTMSDAGYHELIAQEEDAYVRYFKVTEELSDQPLEHCSGQWVHTSPDKTGSISAVAWFFTRKLRQYLDVPVAVINASYGDSNIEAWTAANVFNENADLKEFYIDGNTSELPHRQPSVLYNGMLNPVIPYAIKGIIWYQGESSYNDIGYYAKIQSCMLNDWRAKWGDPEIPFYYVQIAPYLLTGNGNGGPSPNSVQYALFREEQEKSLALIENSGMVVTADIGDYYDIHPKEKEQVGIRLAVYALAESYQAPLKNYQSPLFESVSYNGNTVSVSFKEGTTGSGLAGIENGKYIPGLWIAGNDKVFYRAMLSSSSDQLVVHSDSVTDPVAVRYDFYDCIKAEIFTNEGLPVAPFRTDNWNSEEVQFVEFPLYSLISDFDEQNVSPFNMWGGIGYRLVPNPLVSELNGSENVVKITSSDFPYEGIAYKASEFMQGKLISAVKMKIYAEQADAFSSMLVKLEDSKGVIPEYSIEIHDLYSTGNIWDTISIPIEISTDASYDIITLMPNIWTVNSSEFFIDDIEILENKELSSEQRIVQNIKVYPNPASDYICIDIPTDKENEWRIYSISGSLLMQGINTKGIIDVSALHTGLYFLKIKDQTCRFVIEK